MKIETFELERLQSLWENRVDYNLTESGVHPYTLRELLTPEEIESLLDVRLGYGWTNGAPALREQVASYYPGAGADNVLITSGSAEANFLAMWTLLEPGDEIAVMVPNYLQIWGLARSLGVTVRPFRLREEQNWAPDLDELAAIVTPATRAIVLCNPNNPTGAVLEPAVMEAIVDLAAGVDAQIYADEVYKGVELEGPEGPSFRDLDGRALVASGLSKALAHPGLRIGWLVGPEEFIARAWKRHDYTTITTGLLNEQVALSILQPPRRQQILERNRRLLRSNLALLEDWIGERSERFSFVPPRAGGMAFVRYHYDINSSRLAERLRRDQSLLVLPGDVYGMDNFLRLGIGERPEYLTRGLELLAEGLASLPEGDPPS
ncbi:MAG: aminotransferase class I/II-fold pyridoxal phosphate-dependent enzyme [Acidobacteriota bacterium]